MSFVGAGFSKSRRSRDGKFMISLSLEVSESSARGSQAGINKAFKTFTIQPRAPPPWAFKGTRDFVSLTLDYCDPLFSPFSGCSLTEVQAQIEQRSIFWPPCPGHKSTLGSVLKLCWSHTKLCLVRPRRIFLNCWFLLTLWDPTGPQIHYCWWSQIKSNRGSCKLFFLHFQIKSNQIKFFCSTFKNNGSWPKCYTH